MRLMHGRQSRQVRHCKLALVSGGSSSPCTQWHARQVRPLLLCCWAGSRAWLAANQCRAAVVRMPSSLQQAAATERRLERAGRRQVTVLLNTFNRPVLFRRSVRHWTACSVVARLHVNWAESTTPPNVTEHVRGPMPVTFALPLLTHNDSSLNTRFLPVDGAPPRACCSIVCMHCTSRRSDATTKDKHRRCSAICGLRVTLAARCRGEVARACAAQAEASV